jgi:hypothetical protein
MDIFEKRKDRIANQVIELKVKAKQKLIIQIYLMNLIFHQVK